MVGTLTLARISTWSLEYLAYLGWLDNPIIETLYSMTSAGVWVAKTDTSGRVTEANSSNLATILTANNNNNYLSQTMVPGTVGSIAFPTSTTGPLYHRRVAQIPLTEAAGAIAATVIVPALASYKVRCIVKKIWAPAGTTDAANTWTLAPEAGGTLVGPTGNTMNLTALRSHWIDAGAAGVSGEGIFVYNSVANNGITMAAADLAVVGIDYYLEIEYWYEA